MKEFKGKNGFFIIIVPKSTMPNWKREFEKWAPSMDLLILNPIKEEREETHTQGDGEKVLEQFENIYTF